MVRQTFLENIKKGEKLEFLFSQALEKFEWIDKNYYVELLPNSGRYSGFNFDVLATSKDENNPHYPNLAFDVKGVGGTPLRVYVKPFAGVTVNKQIRNAISQGFIPFFAWPHRLITEKMCKHHKNWYFLYLKYNNWICYLRSYPSYDKMLKRGYPLKKLPEFARKYADYRSKR